MLKKRTPEREAEWIEISPGLYSRQIREGERRVDREFLEQVAEAAEAGSVRQVIVETATRLEKKGSAVTEE